MNQHQSDIYYGIIPDPGEPDRTTKECPECEGWGVNTYGEGDNIKEYQCRECDGSGRVEDETLWDEGEVTPC